LTSKLLCQLLMLGVTSLLSLNVVWFSVYELTVTTRNRQTDKRTESKIQRI